MNLTKRFTQTNSESNNNGNWHAHSDQTKFNMGTPCLDNCHQSFYQLIDRSIGSMCPGLAEPDNPLSCISADQCLNWKTGAVKFLLAEPSEVSRSRHLTVKILSADFAAANKNSGKNLCRLLK